jgi:CRP/FNR family nitrogen fixation transcriptional regulator
MKLAHDARCDGALVRITDAMRRLGLRASYAKDQEIFAQDQAADVIHLVASGAVRTSRLLGDGRRQVGDFYYPGELIGPETGPVHRYSAEALGDGVEVLVMRRATLRGALEDGELDRAIWEATRRELDRAQDHILVLGRKSACERVASFLIDQAQRGGNGGAALAMSRQDMADYLGLTIETVSRMLTQLQDASVVKFDGCRRFKVTRWQALEQMAA